jgi:hypothetical protein
VIALHTVAETGSFLRDAKAAGVSGDERTRIVREVSTIRRWET